MSKIIVYKDINFRGSSRVYTNSVDYIGDSFNDEVSSIIVETGNWVIYKDKGFKGSTSILTPGHYPKAQSWGGHNDDLSSLKPFITQVNLFPDIGLKDNYKQVISLSQEMTNFNKNLNFTAQINSLSGQARSIAIKIQRSLVPRIKQHGQNVALALNITKTAINTLANSMISLLNRLKANFLSTNIQGIQSNLSSIINEVNNIENDVNRAVMSNLDIYHQDINRLISELGSEKNALDEDNDTLEQARQAILDKMNARTHKVCGVVKMVWDSVTFQLQDELNKENEELAHIRFQYRTNTLAIGGANSMITKLQTFQTKLEEQSNYWTSYKAAVDSLKSDIADLLAASDTEMWPMYIDMIQSDWEDLRNIS